MKRVQEKSEIVCQACIQGDYFRVDMLAPGIVPLVRPGQFVHVQLPGFEHRVLRRPFSIFDVDPASSVLSVIYKVVGEGTEHLSGLAPGAGLDLLGPLGQGFSPVPEDVLPVVVAGGYGCAATYLFARSCGRPCLCLFGGRSAGDLLLVKEFEELGCEVRVSTDDGSAGHRGFVTDLLDDVLDSAASLSVVACGPNPMLRAVGQIVLARGFDAELSLDHVMCCGVGACFACVIKLKADNEDGWEYVRTCLDGPVFKASDVVWD